MNKVILITTNHPLYAQVTKLQYPCYTLHTPDDISIIEDHQSPVYMDFTLFNTDNKSRLFNELKGDIISDLSCAWGEMLFEKYDSLKAGFAAAFHSPRNTIEYFKREEQTELDLNHFFQELGLSLHQVSSCGHGFIFPRTVSMIINEAYFSLEDKLAREEDIDTAMNYGVNYPLGPFAWARHIGLTPIKMLLDDLYQSHHDKRYKLSTLLRKREMTL